MERFVNGALGMVLVALDASRIEKHVSNIII